MTEEQHFSFSLSLSEYQSISRCHARTLFFVALCYIQSACQRQTGSLAEDPKQLDFPAACFETSNLLTSVETITLLTSVDTSKYFIFRLHLSKFGCTSVIFRLLAGERLPADTPRCCCQCQCTTTGLTASPVGFTADGCYQCQSGWFH